MTFQSHRERFLQARCSEQERVSERSAKGMRIEWTGPKHGTRGQNIQFRQPGSSPTLKEEGLIVWIVYEEGANSTLWPSIKISVASNRLTKGLFQWL